MGTAAVQGELWGAKARDWAEVQEPAWTAVFDRALDLAGVGAGTRLLDIGCGAGGALVLARARGADVAGLDASDALTAVARSRLPGARIETGEMEELPFLDKDFDAVTGINAFQFAGDMARALAEARRVCRAGGTVLVLAWGDRERCELQKVVLGALAPYLPPQAPAPPSQGAIEAAMERAGLAVEAAGSFEAALDHASHALALRALLSAGIATRIERQAGAEPVRTALAAALRPFVRPDGTVSLANDFRWVRATR
jgi:cyclopropane fatty-acyl-phospholipid synthase-like methyltransferase